MAGRGPRRRDRYPGDVLPRHSIWARALDALRVPVGNATDVPPMIADFTEPAMAMKVPRECASTHRLFSTLSLARRTAQLEIPSSLVQIFA